MSELIKGAGKSKLRLYLATALMLALAITGGLFAYAYTQDVATITASLTTGDFANVTDCTTFPSYNVFGSYRGALPEGYLFEILPTTGYPGDIAVNVYLSNIDELGKHYGLWMMRVQIVDSSNVTIDKEDATKILSLRNGAVSFVSDEMPPGATYYVRSDGGVYRSHCFAYITGFGAVNPQITAEILQAGL